ncbi:MAG: response regulator [Desulfocapsaceae bacterium]|nr:response regulator [Desulfocapsaceae bacterium]
MNASRPLVLIVDDNATNIDLLVNTLKDDYRLGIAKRGASALDYAAKYHPDLILLDIMMPEMDGYEVCARLKEDPGTRSIPLIFISGMTETVNKTKGFDLGAVDYITKPFHTAEVKARVQAHIALQEIKSQLQSQNSLLEQMVEKKTVEIQEMLQGIISSMALMVEIRDPYTAGHQQRVSQLACAIATRMGVSARMIEGIRIAGLLHDVGKIRVPVSILSRTGALLAAEMEVLKIHPQIGYEILKNIPFPWPCAQMVYQHHERLDGSGYPQGLRGDEILLESRILAVADVTEAQSSFRPYRPAQGIESALATLKERRGRAYDANAVDACLDLFADGSFHFTCSASFPVSALKG